MFNESQPIAEDFSETSLEQSKDGSPSEEIEEASDEETDEEILTTPETLARKFSVKITSTPIPRLRTGRKENFFFALTCNGVELTERIPAKLQWDACVRIEVRLPREMAFNGCAIFNTPVKSISKEPVRSHCFEMISGNPEHHSKIEWNFCE